MTLNSFFSKSESDLDGYHFKKMFELQEKINRYLIEKINADRNKEEMVDKRMIYDLVEILQELVR